MQGRGETIADGPEFPPLPCVLVNPGWKLSTADVFANLQTRRGAVAPRLPTSLPDVLAVAKLLSAQGNDLEAPAIRLCPDIARAKAALAACDGAILARMSGSGATCFALFPDDAAAQAAAVAVKRAQPKWWVAATRIAEPAA